MSPRARMTDPAALETLYATPTSDLVASTLPWWHAALAAAWAWGQKSVGANEIEPEDRRRQRLERIALEHARALTTDSMIRKTVRLSQPEIVEVLGHIARLTDTQRWVRVSEGAR